MSKCSNCGITQGPFSSFRVVGETYFVCKNTKTEKERSGKCVARRDKIDYEKYKESMNLIEE